MKLDKDKPYGTNVDLQGPTTYLQNGISFDGDGNPISKRQVKAYYDRLVAEANETAAEAQKLADEANESAEAAKLHADTVMKGIKDANQPKKAK